MLFRPNMASTLCTKWLIDALLGGSFGFRARVSQISWEYRPVIIKAKIFEDIVIVSNAVNKLEGKKSNKRPANLSYISKCIHRSLILS